MEFSLFGFGACNDGFLVAGVVELRAEPWAFTIWLTCLPREQGNQVYHRRNLNHLFQINLFKGLLFSTLCLWKEVWS